MTYLRRILNYKKRITLSDPTHMISMTYLVAINVETSRINDRCSLEEEFIIVINMNPYQSS